MAWYDRLQKIDPRIIYLVVFVLVSIPFFVPIPVKMEVSPVVKKLYDKVEQIAEDNKRYGVDWVNFGFRQMRFADYMAFIRDMYAIISKDYRGTPIRDVPMMKNIRGLRDFALVFDVTGSSAYADWVYYAQPEAHFDIGVGVTAIIGPSIRPLIDAGQVVGMMEGLSGAAQYEQLLNIRGQASRGMGSQNLAHLWVIVALILGNIGYIASRRREKKLKKELK